MQNTVNGERAASSSTAASEATSQNHAGARVSTTDEQDPAHSQQKQGHVRKVASMIQVHEDFDTHHYTRNRNERQLVQSDTRLSKAEQQIENERRLKAAQAMQRRRLDQELEDKRVADALQRHLSIGSGSSQMSADDILRSDEEYARHLHNAELRMHERLNAGDVAKFSSGGDTADADDQRRRLRQLSLDEELARRLQANEEHSARVLYQQQHNRVKKK